MSALNYPATLTTPDGTVIVYDQGAHVSTWFPTGSDPVLFVSRESAFEEGVPIRGGIPVCFPWFGPGRSGDRAPAHGFARILPWTRVALDESSAAYELTEAALSREQRQTFPHDFSARLEVTTGDSLELRLTTANTGEDAFEIEEALHAYLSVGDVRDVTIRGLENTEYLDKLLGADRMPPAGEPLRITAETDRVYLCGGTVVVEDPVLERRLSITTKGAANTVVWNPWTDKAARMKDFGDDEWPAMLCVEGANVMEDAVRIEPGASHELVYRIEIAPL